MNDLILLFSITIFSGAICLVSGSISKHKNNFDSKQSIHHSVMMGADISSKIKSQ